MKPVLSDFMDFDLEDVNDTGYERDIDVKIMDGFHLESTLYQVNDKVQQFAFYWMKLYSNCCIQRDEALRLLRLGYVDDANKKLEDWPETLGCLQARRSEFESEGAPRLQGGWISEWAEGPFPVGVRGHAPPEKFENLDTL